MAEKFLYFIFHQIKDELINMLQWQNLHDRFCFNFMLVIVNKQRLLHHEIWLINVFYIYSLFTIVAPSRYDSSSESRANYPYDAEKEEILNKLKSGQFKIMS